MKPPGTLATAAGGSQVRQKWTILSPRVAGCIAQQNHARGEPAFFDEVEIQLALEILEHRIARAKDQRHLIERVLVTNPL